MFLLLPLGLRLGWYYRGTYEAPEIAPIEEYTVDLPERVYEIQEPAVSSGDGRVIFDLSHNNNLGVDDLAPLQNMLSARSAEFIVVDGVEHYLDTSLRGATALVVLAPTLPLTAFEQDAVLEFVRDGGRVLVAADPTRPVLPDEGAEFLDLTSVLLPTSAVPAVNSLARLFNVVFFEDYLYNLTENAGNYRNVNFTALDQDEPLTRGLQRLTFFAAHSISGDGVALVMADSDTQSNLRVGPTELSPALLAADGRVLALGDVTFLTPPFPALADNGLFLGRIADWLAQDARDWDLADFPHLFERPVNLIQIPGEELDPRLVIAFGELAVAVDRAGLELELQTEEEDGRDALYVGTFDQLEPVAEILASKGVSITVTIQEEELPTSESEEIPEGEPLEEATPVPEPAGGQIHMEELGSIATTGSTLFVLDRTPERVTVVVLGEDGNTSIDALRRLSNADFFGCVEAPDLVLCSTGLADQGGGLDFGPGGEPGLGVGPGGSVGGTVFILSDDDGPAGAQTSAADIEAALAGSYETRLWSTSVDGIPDAADVAGYDAYVIDSGDYEYDTDDFDTFFAFSEIEGGVLFIGSQPLPAFEGQTAPLQDLQVTDASHPLASGFGTEEVLDLSPSVSGVPPLLILAEDFLAGDDTTSVVFSRGPSSEEPGAPVILASDQDGNRTILAAVAFYRLAPEAQVLFALNAVAWLIGG